MTESTHSTKTFLSLNNEALATSITELTPLLADTLFLYNLYKKYHWHVTGEDFYQYHLLFDKHADEQLPIADSIAERIRTLGGNAPGMPSDVDKNKTADEPNDAGNNGQKMIQNLCKVHEAIISRTREAVEKTTDAGDEGTADLLVSELLRVHELQLWFIRSSLR
jgi:starvation-inducible DNA-binding protein